MVKNFLQKEETYMFLWKYITFNGLGKEGGYFENGYLECPNEI
jgi:hypothetical protein